MPASPRHRPLRRPTRVALLLAVGVGVGVAMGATMPPEVEAHPTPEELAAHHADRQACLHGDPEENEDGRRLEGIRLGMRSAELQGQIDGLRRVTGVETTDGARPTETDAGRDALQRWIAPGTDDVASIEIETWRGRVYRIRWRLEAAFERPIVDDLAARASGCLGSPDLDQTFEAEPGSADATLRRVVWDRAEHRIELRQLHPLRGGPISLSVLDPAVLREIGAAGRVPPPEPRRSEPWWKRSTTTPEPPTDAERDRLARRFLHLVFHLL